MIMKMELLETKDLVIEGLDELAEKQATLTRILAEKEEAYKAIVAPVQDRIDDLEALYAEKTQALIEEIAIREGGIKDSVVALRESVKGSLLHAVYAKGRVSWDNGKLEGYAAAGHPEILDFRSEGKPSVSMRTVALKENTDK
jgi:hypothetical protein